MDNIFNNPQSIFPDCPRQIPVVDTTNGYLTPFWDLALASVFQALQVNFKNEGILIPKLNIDQITTIQNIYVPYIGGPMPYEIQDITGQMVFDITNKLCKQFVIVFDTPATPDTNPNIISAQWRTLQYV